MGDSVRSDPAAIVRDFYDKLNSEETFAEALGLLDDEFVVHHSQALPWGGEYHGRDGFVELITRLTGMVTPELEGAMEFYGADDDHVLVRATGRFISTASGESAITNLVEVFAVRDGKLIDMDIYYKDPGSVAALVAQ